MVYFKIVITDQGWRTWTKSFTFTPRNFPYANQGWAKSSKIWFESRIISFYLENESIFSVILNVLKIELSVNESHFFANKWFESFFCPTLMQTGKSKRVNDFLHVRQPCYQSWHTGKDNLSNTDLQFLCEKCFHSTLMHSNTRGRHRRMHTRELFLSFYLKTKAFGRKLVGSKIVQHAIFYLGAYFHMFWLIIEWVNIVFQLFYTVGLTWIPDFTFKAQHGGKYWSYQKKLQTKVVWN